jgi:hypothetical protein
MEMDATAHVAGPACAPRYPDLWDLAGGVVERYQQLSFDRYQLEMAIEERWRVLIPELYRQPFDKTKLPPFVNRAEVDAVLEWQYGPMGMYIAGAPGGGKTRAVAALAHRLLQEGRTVHFTNSSDFSNLCAKGLVEGMEDKLSKLKADIARPDVFILDDMGVRWSDKTLEGIYQLLETRGGRMKPVIITTNFDEKVTLEKIGTARSDMADKIVSRRRRYCQTVRF